MEENFIYDDLAPQGDLGTIITDLQTRNDELTQHVASLEDDIKKLCDRITEMKSVQDTLQKNISELFNTAKNELDRKDRRISELQNQLDDMIFKRGQPSYHSGFKRKLEQNDSVGSNKIPKCETVGAPQNPRSGENCDTTGGKGRIGPKEEDVCKSRMDRLKQDLVFPDHARQDAEMRKTHPRDHHRDNNYPRESYSNYYNNMRERRSRRDNYRDHNRDWNNQRDRIDNREMKMEQRDSHRESRYDNRGYFDRSREPRSKSKDYRDNNREHRESYREHREHTENWRDNCRVSTGRKERSCEYNNEIRQHGQHRNDQTDNIKYSQENYNQDNWHSETKPEFSEAESTSTLFDTTEISEDAKEDGELTDEASQKVRENDLAKKKGFGRDQLLEKKKVFSVDEYIQKQKSLQNNVKNSRKNKTNDNNEGNKVNFPTENIIRETEIITEQRKRSCEDKNKNAEIKSLEKTKKIEQPKNTSSLCDEKKIPTINLISQIIIHEEVKDQQTNASASRSQPDKKGKSQPKNQESNKSQIVGAKIVEKKKVESGVPRNLTDELNINMESLRKRDKLMIELFGSSEKKANPRSSHQFSPSYGLTLSHDGEIPKMKLFSSPCTEDISENSKSSDEIIPENPVTKFQIFKTNLPQLEKSNSLSTISVQFQTPDKAENKILPPNENLKNPISEKVEESSKQWEQSGKSVSEQYENHPTNEVCNMNLDILDMDIAQCKAEDFPNLTAHSDSKDRSNFPPTTSEKSDKKVQKKPMNVSETGKSKSNMNENKKSLKATVTKSPNKPSKASNKKANSLSSISGQIQIMADVNVPKGAKKNPSEKSKLSDTEKEVQPISKELDSKERLLLSHEKFDKKSLQMPNSDMKLDEDVKTNQSNSKDISDLLLTPSKENIDSVSKKSISLSKAGKSAMKIKTMDSTPSFSQVSPEKGNQIVLTEQASTEITSQIEKTDNVTESTVSNEEKKEEAKSSKQEELSTERIVVVDQKEIHKATQSSSKIQCDSDPIDIKTKSVPIKSTSTVRTRKNANKKATGSSTSNPSKNVSETNNNKSNSLKNITEKKSELVNATSSKKEVKTSEQQVKRRKSVPAVNVDDISKQKEISTKHHTESAAAQSQFHAQKDIGEDHLKSSSSDNCNPGLDLQSKPIDGNKETTNPNGTNNSGGNKNVDEESVNVIVPDSCGEIVKESKESVNVKKELLAQTVSTISPTQTKTALNSRRRRCVVKWV